MKKHEGRMVMRLGIRIATQKIKYTSYAHNITHEGEDENQAFAGSSFQITAHYIDNINVNQY